MFLLNRHLWRHLLHTSNFGHVHLLLGEDVREQLIATIAASVATAGTFELSMGSGTTQQMVDLHWCAHRAGRRLGIKVRVSMVEARSLDRTDHDERVTMIVSARPLERPAMLP
jgi:hypothetical protein